jgi:hypothetical protein
MEGWGWRDGGMEGWRDGGMGDGDGGMKASNECNEGKIFLRV